MKRYAIVGSGYRGLYMFGKRLSSETYKQSVDLVGVCDPNRKRAEFFSAESGGTPVYTDYKVMLDTAKPDVVIVSTIDAVHDEYIVKALERGIQVISEKPMTIDPARSRRIQEAEKRTGINVKVVFNMRYMPLQRKIKEVIASGRIGEVQAVNMEWYLDTRHGADYFRRWHRHMDKSGGLLVHKSTHHFDLINWWLDDRPQSVQANGDLVFYGPNRDYQGVRCQGCPHQDKCEFYWDITSDPIYEGMYHQTESEDGYIRDGCVFGDDIDIYDTMAVQVEYEKGAMLNYSLIAYSPYEGWHLSITGKEGRLEVNEFLSGPRSAESSDRIMFYGRDGSHEVIEIPKLEGSHGGSDDLLLSDLVFGRTTADELGQQATSQDGVYSLIIGSAANQAIKTRERVNIAAYLES